MRHLTFDTPSAAQWRPLDSRFAQLEGRLTQHRRWLEKETESQIQDFMEVEQHRRRYLRFLHRRNEVNLNSNGELEEQRLTKRLRRVEIVRNWLSNNSQTQQTGNNATHTEHLGSCNWFFDLPKYCDLKNRRYDRSQANDTQLLQSDWHERVVFVQGAWNIVAPMQNLGA